MKGLNFKFNKPVAASAPNRTDVTCFIGLVSVRKRPDPASEPKFVLTPEIRRWLENQQWLHRKEEDNPNPNMDQKSPYHRNEALNLMDVPVPVEDWDTFNQLYEWENRPLDKHGLVGSTYLGAAIRSFFAQGGRKCYVIRVGDPLQLNATSQEKDASLEKILPGFPNSINSSPFDRNSWHGLGHLHGLPDVSFVSMPDLPFLFSSRETASIKPPEPVKSLPEQFVECSEPAPLSQEDKHISTLPPPQCNVQGFIRWGNAVHHAANFIAEYKREVQWVTSIPLSHSFPEANGNILTFLNKNQFLSGNLEEDSSIASAFVQLSYPWVRTEGSSSLPGALEPPEGALIGLLARNALTKGTFHSAVGKIQQDIKDLFPKLSQSEIYSTDIGAPDLLSRNLSLVDRVSLFSFTPKGIQLLSDVTTSHGSTYRPASINRTISMIVRAARRLGEEVIFENSGEKLWSQITSRLSDFLLALLHLGALRGKSPEEAYHVRCDRSTMTQQDIDSGRVIAQIIFEPAASIETIDIHLSMDVGGQVLLSSLGLQETLS